MISLFGYKVRRRALIAACLAIASFVLTSVLKANLDQRIQYYQSIIDRARSFEADAINRIALQSQSAFFSQLTLLQAINNSLNERSLEAQQRRPPHNFFVPQGAEWFEQVFYIMSRFTDYVFSLPRETLDRPVSPRYGNQFKVAMKFRLYDRDRMLRCIRSGSGQRPNAYIKQITDAYEGGLAGPDFTYKAEPATIFDGYNNLTLLIRAAQSAEIASHGRDFAADAAEATAEAGRSISSTDQFIASHPLMNSIGQRCIYPAVQAYQRGMEVLTRYTAEMISKEYLSPLQWWKQILIYFEVLLYVITALYGLSKSEGADDASASGRPVDNATTAQAPSRAGST